jgi:hypothetical protein
MAVEEGQMELGYYQCRMIRQCFHESISAIERFNNLTPAVLQQSPVQAPCVVVGFDHQDSTRDSAVVVEERGHRYTRRYSETINIAFVASKRLSSQWRLDSWLASTVVVVIACATRSLFTRMSLVTHSMAVSRPRTEMLPRLFLYSSPRKARGIGGGDTSAWSLAPFDERWRVVPRVHLHSVVCAATKDHQGSSEKIASVSVKPLTACWSQKRKMTER